MKKKKNGFKILIVILVIVGLSVLLYPRITDFLYNRQAQSVITEFRNRMELDDESLEQLYQLLVEYNRSLYENKQKDLVDPFSYKQVDFSLEPFGFDEELIGHLTIKKMDIDLPVYLGATEENMSKGAGHLTQTSIPVGGENTNAVIAAHRGYSRTAMFRDIEKLELGDEVLFTNFRETLVYQVAEIKVILPTDIDEVLIQDGRDLITLITCHPYRHNYQRYVVYCERAKPAMD
jgi:sortase A